MEQLLILRDLAVIFGASLVVILVFHRLRLPALPGFIVAGVLLGPNALGFIPDVHRVEGLAEVGVILLLFTIGIEKSSRITPTSARPSTRCTDRKSTRLNSSHTVMSYAVFCLKKKHYRQ